MPLVVEQLRGGLVETVHPIVAALADADGVRWSIGGSFGCFWRSSSKPMQLVSSLEQLPSDLVAGLSAAELALGAASHGATDAHTAVVSGLLARFGQSVDGLRCGAHWPSHEPSHDALVRAGLPCTAIHNNCSGKHTFMLAAAAARGWELDYRPIDHPLQRVNHGRIEEWCGTDAGVAVDGCGVPTFHVPVEGMARAFARLAAEMRTDSLAGRVGRAMHAEADLVSSPGEIDVTLVRSSTETVTAKRGAEGLVCVAFPERGWGLAVKALTGNGAALAVGLAAVLAEIAPGVLGDGWPFGEVRNVAGRVVGERRAVWG
jgi:L-asparaginase II